MRKSTLTPEEQRLRRNAWQKKWNEKNPDKIRAIQRVFRQRHKDKVNAKQRQYYSEHTEDFARYAKTARASHKDKIAADKAAYYQRNKEKIAIHQKQWRDANIDTIRQKEWEKVLKRIVAKPGFFYIIRFNEFIKIGETINWDRRKREYEMHNPVEMEVIYCEQKENANVLEHLARGHFRQYAYYRGIDWFSHVPEEVLNEWLLTL